MTSEADGPRGPRSPESGAIQPGPGPGDRLVHPGGGGASPSAPPRPSANLPLRTRVILIVAFVALAAFSAHRLYCAGPVDGIVVFAGQTMGTTWQVKVADGDLGPEGQTTIASAIAASLDRVNGLMSTWDPESEISRLNRHAEATPFPLSPENVYVFGIALEASRLSGGAFDVTIAPLVALWGFGSSARIPETPTDAEIRAARARVGWQGLELDTASGTLVKRSPDLQCDLSAIAKGYGVDAVADGLEALGHAQFLVEIGGEVRARGRRPDGFPWRVAIERPDEAERRVLEAIPLEDAALATSGDYRNFWTDGELRNSHTIDPRTGRPIRHALASVSVVYEDTTHADAYATMLNVLGPEEGLALAREEGLAVLFVERLPGGGFRDIATPAFERLREKAAESP